MQGPKTSALRHFFFPSCLPCSFLLDWETGGYVRCVCMECRNLGSNAKFFSRLTCPCCLLFLYVCDFMLKAMPLSLKAHIVYIDFYFQSTYMHVYMYVSRLEQHEANVV